MSETTLNEKDWPEIFYHAFSISENTRIAVIKAGEGATSFCSYWKELEKSYEGWPLRSIGGNTLRAAPVPSRTEFMEAVKDADAVNLHCDNVSILKKKNEDFQLEYDSIEDLERFWQKMNETE